MSNEKESPESIRTKYLFKLFNYRYGRENVDISYNRDIHYSQTKVDKSTSPLNDNLNIKYNKIKRSRNIEIPKQM